MSSNLKRVKLEDLKTAANEFNGLFGLDPVIDVKLGRKELENKIIMAIDMIQKDDKFSKITQNIIDAVKNKSPVLTIIKQQTPTQKELKELEKAEKIKKGIKVGIETKKERELLQKKIEDKKNKPIITKQNTVKNKKVISPEQAEKKQAIKDRNELTVSFIKEAKYTIKQVKQKVIEKFPQFSLDSVNLFIYNNRTKGKAKLDSLIIINKETKILSFEDK